MTGRRCNTWPRDAGPFSWVRSFWLDIAPHRLHAAAMRPLLLLFALMLPSAHADPVPEFWRASEGTWLADADYYGADGIPQMHGYAQLNRLRVTEGRVFLEDSAFYPAGGRSNQVYSLGLARPGEGVEVRNTQSGPIAADGSVTLDRADIVFGSPVRTRIAPVDGRRALQTGDKSDGTRGYEAYWSLTAPGRRLRLLIGIDPVAPDGGPPKPGAFRALAMYRDTAITSAEEPAARERLQGRLAIGVVRHVMQIDGTRYDLAERLGAGVTDCDRRASDPADPQRVVAFNGPAPPLDAAARAACTAAARERPDEVRFRRALERIDAALAAAPSR
jgi:hypothetical protein